MSDNSRLSQRPIVEFDLQATEMAEDELDQQAFGVIRLDRIGQVLSYNLYEEGRARMRRKDVIGKNFFSQVAPCTKVQEFYGQFLEGVERRELNVTFAFAFPFPHGVRHVDVCLYYKQRDDTIWVLIRG
jgi:photoactive yellow protein